MIINGQGPAVCDIVFVGDYPDKTEVNTCKAFDSHIYKELFYGTGVFKNGCYRTLVIKEDIDRTVKPKEAIKKYIDLESRKKEKPESVKYQAFKDILRDELAGLQFNLIVAVGDVALYALTGKTSVFKHRGSILDCTLIPGKKVIPIIHPRTIFAQYKVTHYIKHDMFRIVEESKYPEKRLPEANFVLRPSYEETMNFLDICDKSERVGFDIEILNNEVSCLSFAYDMKNVISIPFVENNSDYFNPKEELDILLRIANILENPDINKIMQNGTFDTWFMFQAYGIHTVNVDDTMIAHALAFADFPKGLDFITSTKTRWPYYKDEGKAHFKEDTVNMSFWRYNALDSLVLMEAMPKLEEDLRRLNNYEAYLAKIKDYGPLIFMQTKGMKVDLERLEMAKEFAQKQIEHLTQRLYGIVGRELNPNSPQQLQEFFYKEMKIKPYKNKKSKKPSTDEMALKRIISGNHPQKAKQVAELILQIRRVVKLKGTYLDVVLDKDQRIRGAQNAVGTKSGRTSSSKLVIRNEEGKQTGNNMYNQPHEIKTFYIGDDYAIPWSVDLGQAENRVVAYLGPEPKMIKAFEDGTDIHSLTAALIFSKELEDVSKVDGSCALGNGQHSERYWGKKANHGLNYDFREQAFALQYEIPFVDARFIVNRYHIAYPGVRNYHSWVKEQLNTNGRKLTDLFGKSKLFLDRWGDTMFKEAYSFIPQSTVTTMIEVWGLQYLYYNQNLFHATELLNAVYDSIEAQTLKSAGYEHLAETWLRLKDSLEQPLHWKGYTFSIPADFEIGTYKNGLKPNFGNTMFEIKDMPETVTELAPLIKMRFEEYMEVPNA